MFFAFDAIFLVLFVVVFIIIISSWVKGISTWNKNNNSPRLKVEASVVSKRIKVLRHHHGGGAGMNHHYTTKSTSYFVTFQVESGDRMELNVTGEEYGMLVEGDFGDLIIQGTRFLGFTRK